MHKTLVEADKPYGLSKRDCLAGTAGFKSLYSYERAPLS